MPTAASARAPAAASGVVVNATRDGGSSPAAQDGARRTAMTSPLLAPVWSRLGAALRFMHASAGNASSLSSAQTSAWEDDPAFSLDVVRQSAAHAATGLSGSVPETPPAAAKPPAAPNALALNGGFNGGGSRAAAAAIDGSEQALVSPSANAAVGDTGTATSAAAALAARVGDGSAVEDTGEGVVATSAAGRATVIGGAAAANVSAPSPAADVATSVVAPAAFDE